MNKPKFTEGPWCVLPEEVDKPYIRIRGTVLGSRYKVANVVTPTYEGVHEREAVETRANARLIKMAPIMYKFLDDIANGRVLITLLNSYYQRFVGKIMIDQTELPSGGFCRLHNNRRNDGRK